MRPWRCITEMFGMRNRIAALIVGVFLLSPTADAFMRGGLTTNIPTVTAGWKQILVGAGGFFTRQDVASDNTLIMGLDGPGAHIWNATATAQNGATGTWQPLVTMQTMRNTSLAANPQGFQAGIFEIKMQYGNSSNLYMVYPKWTYNAGASPTCVIYGSTDKGATWTEKAGYFASCNTFTPWNDTNYRFYNNKMAVDPTNASNFLFAPQADGLYYSHDGGASVTKISTAVVPNGTGAGNAGVLYDPTNVSIAYTCVNGTGVYRSTNAGASPPTFSATSGGPTGCRYTDIDRNNGTFYAIDEAGQNLWRYNGTWTKVLTNTLFGSAPSMPGVAVDPGTANHIIVHDIQGSLNESTNSGTGWGGWANSEAAPTYSYTNDAGWIAKLNPNQQWWGISFDRTNSNALNFNTANGAYTVTLSGAITGGTVITQQSKSRGVENLTALHVLSVPTSPTSILVSGWDHAIYSKTASNLDSYPSTFGPQQPAQLNSQLCVAADVDYASSNTSVIGTECDGISGYGQPTWYSTGFSTDDGATWTQWTSFPTGKTNGGANVAFSSPSNCMFAPSGGILPSFSNNCNVAAPTWTQISLPGAPSMSQFLQSGAASSMPKEIAADRVNAGYFYLLDPNVGFFYTQNTGTSWTAGATNSDTALTKAPIMKAVPGLAQDLFVAGGLNGGAGLQPQGGLLYHTVDGFATTPCQIASMANPVSVGYGKAKSGNTFPAVYVVGWVTDNSATTTTFPTAGASFTITVSTGSAYYPVGRTLSIYTTNTFGNFLTGVVTAYNSGTGALTITVTNVGTGSGSFSNWQVFIPGIWRNDNFSHTTCNPGAVAASWQLVGTQYPLNSMQQVNDIDGDMATEGMTYISLGVQGWAYYHP